MNRIYDPYNPTLNGFPVCRHDPSIPQFIAAKVFKWYSEALWSFYGRNRIVAWYMHNEHTLVGKLENWLATQILKYIYDK